MIEPPANTQIWIAAGVTDLRRGFDGLSALVQSKLEKSPLSGQGCHRERSAREEHRYRQRRIRAGSNRRGCCCYGRDRAGSGAGGGAGGGGGGRRGAPLDHSSSSSSSAPLGC